MRSGTAETKPDGVLGPRIRILLVEDDSDAASMITTGIEKEPGFEIVRAADGIEAIELAVRYNPDIFVVDGMLPKMTGYQLVTMLRKNRVFGEAPIVFISGKATPRDRQYAERLGINHFLPKPFEASALLEVINAVAQTPGFKIHEDRVSSKQLELEKLRDFDAHRMDSRK